MAFQGDAFQGNGWQVGFDAVTLVDAYTLTRGPLITRRNVTPTFEPVLATRQGTPLTLLSGGTPVTPPPPNQYDWPNPTLATVRRQDFYKSFLLTLIGQDQFFGAPGQGPNYDYPNPRGPQYPQDLRSFSNAYAPYFPNVNPFSSNDLPVPRGPLRSISLLSHLDPLKLPLLQPFAQTEWPLPVRPLPRSNPDFWWRNIACLYGQDTIYYAPGEAPTYDYPNPRAPKRGNQDFNDRNIAFLNGKDTIYGAPGEVPTYDWQNPRGPQYPINLRTWAEHDTPLLYGQDTFFGAPGQGPANLDWPVPKGPAFPIENRSFIQGFYLTPQTPPQIPPYAYDYPNPRGAQFPQELRTWVRGNDALTQVHTPSPLNFDFPNPRGPQRSIDLLSNINTTAPYIPVDKPLNQYDWPNPRAPQFSNEFRSWVQFYFLGNIVQLPPNQYDWPNPRGPAFARDMLSLWDRRKLGYEDTFFGGPGQPPANLDWPVPKGPKFAREMLTIGNNWPMIFPTPTPPATTDQFFPFIHNMGSLMQRS